MSLKNTYFDIAGIIVPLKYNFLWVYRKYQIQINNETTVEMGGANPMINSDELSIWLNQYDNGIRNRKVAIRL